MENKIPKQDKDSYSIDSIEKIDAAIAHEINNPLSFVIANLKKLKQYTNRVFLLVEAYEKTDVSPESSRANIFSR
ncbi:MAG: hypothetical protein HQK61_10785 [Desulfamplus sp.]|nr:hypothetical protein [Desulfamplus sp.]